MQQSPRKPKTPEESFGSAVSLRRAAQELSQREFAGKLTERGMTVDASAVSRIENGSRSVRLTEALLIAEVLDVELDSLIIGSKTPAQEFKALRRYANTSLNELQSQMVDTAFALWEASDHLRRHPELLATLKDEGLGVPSSPEHYFRWMAERIKRWEIPADEYLTTDSEELAVDLVGVFSAIASQQIGTEDPWAELDQGSEESEGANGVDPEEA